MENPITKFREWWEEALVDSPLNQKSVVCVSTINRDGYPTGRFVDLKSVTDEGFTFCTHLDSEKGNDISRDPKISLTAWWDHVGYQVRVAGTAKLLSDQMATEIWKSRSRDAQLTTTAFKQSYPLRTESDLEDKFNRAENEFSSKTIPKPDNWGGYILRPATIEFLTFRESRLHLRELYRYNDSQWAKTLLQP